MEKSFDEISLEYWDSHKTKTKRSKSYSCLHSGHIYGDNMTFEDIAFVYKKSDVEEKKPDIHSEAKWAYFDFVQSSCNNSNETLQRFLSNGSEKYRVYTEDQVSRFSKKQQKSTRIKDQSCKILVSNKPYYVANNLKICEYFNSASMNVDPEDKNNWFIRIYFIDDKDYRAIDREEVEEVEGKISSYAITVIPRPTYNKETNSRRYKDNIETKVRVNYETLNKAKKETGDLGEAIVLDYEQKRLIDEGRPDLANIIEHTSKDKGDKYGYDIISFLKDGSPLYIEVKATKHNKIADFYISENERKVGNAFYFEGKNYRIYRIYNIDTKNGTGNLTVFEPPFDSDHYIMESENWRIQLKNE